MQTAPMTFVACPSYHGATLLGLILNNHSQLAALGDTLPERAHMDYFCSCGERIGHCRFWNDLARATGADAHASEPTLLPMRPRLVGNERANKLLNRLVFGDRLISRACYRIAAGRMQRFEANFDRFAHAVCDLLGKKQFVDGTKDLHRLFVLARANPQRRIHCIHLLRDPRGFVLSCRNNLPPPWHPRQQALNWRRYHYLVVQLCTMLPNVRYLPVRYEDLCDRPKVELRRIFSFVGVEHEEVLTAPRAPHHVIGNRMLRQFQGNIAKDEKWRTVLSEGEQSDILRSASPFGGLFRYDDPSG